MAALVNGAPPVVPLQWFGGKANHLNFILPNLPKADRFVDVFGGSGSVTINRPRDMDRDRVWNDAWPLARAMMRQVRDDGPALALALMLTPYSRSEYVACAAATDKGSPTAREFMAFVSQRYGSTPHAPMAGSWRRHSNPANSRRNMPLRSRPGQIKLAADRLQGVKLMCADALDVIRDHDSEGTLFYCDPPYVDSTRRGGEYEHMEYSDDDHRALAELLSSIEGRAAVSGYRSDLYEEILPRSRGWRAIDDKDKGIAGAVGRGRSGRQVETLWVNW